MRTWRAALSIVSFCLLLARTGLAYEVVPVTNGGTITGTVLLKGTKPAPKAYNLVLFPEPAYCGRISTGTGWRLLDQFLVGPEGGLQHAVVMLEGIEKGKPFPSTSPQIEARDCMFSPSVMVVRDGDEVGVVNMDPILHDVQAYEISPSGSRILLHRPLRLNPYHPRNGAETHEHLAGEQLIDHLQFSRGRRVFVIECGFHEYMQTWGVRVDNPYFAVTDEGGKFTLTEVPPGVYNLVVWHAGMGGILQAEVAILSGEHIKTRFEFDAPPPRDSAHTTMVENPHYDVEVLGILGNSVEIQPTHERQQP